MNSNHTHDATHSSISAALILFVALLLGATPIWAADFEEVAKLFAADGAPSDSFGASVAVSGDTVVIGAFGGDDNGSQSGAAYVFVRSAGLWSRQAKLLALDGAAGDLFGISVAVAGDTVVIGADRDDDAGASSGSAYVFTRTAGVWVQQAKLTAADDTAEDAFGISVAVAGDTVVIGAFGDDDAGSLSGSAYVFTRMGSSWSQQAKLAAADGTAFDQFGNSVAVSGDTAVIGAFGDDETGIFSGSAYVFARTGSSWSQQAKFTAATAAVSNRFGTSVAVAGNTAVIGASGDDDDAGSRSGSAYVFTRSGSGWSQQAKLTAADGAVHDRFGISVAVSGDTAVIGAFGDDDAGTDSGSAYVFAPNPAITALEQLIATVMSFNLQQGIENGLDAKLDAAILALDDIGNNNDDAAINMLVAFIQNVEAQRGTHLTDAQVDQLVAEAQAIIDLLSI